MLSVILIRRYHLKGLRKLTVEVKALREGVTDNLIAIIKDNDIGKLAHEINLIYLDYKNIKENMELNQVNVQREVFEQAGQLHLTMNKLEKAAQTDALTGLANRAFLEKSINSLFIKAIDKSYDLACIMIRGFNS